MGTSLSWIVLPRLIGVDNEGRTGVFLPGRKVHEKVHAPQPLAGVDGSEALTGLLLRGFDRLDFEWSRLASFMWF